MKHLGDITKINGADVDPVEVIIGGSPCQDLSVAGKREGLSGERSGLFMEQIRIIKEMREHDRQNGAAYIRPRYMVFENVHGVFSSNKGEDFRIVLEETARVVDPTAVISRPEKGKWTNSGAIMGNGWSIAWRVFDAQFWGVPQRRRRIALVADFGGATAPEILFECKGVSGDITQSTTPWKDFASAIARRFNSADRKSTGAGIAYSFYSLSSNSMKSNNPNSGCRKVDIAKTIDTTIPDPSKNQGGVAIVAFAQNQRDEVRDLGEASGKVNTLVATDYKDPPIVCEEPYYIVRRLTPLECERLQGFPDGWTDIGDYTDTNGKKRKTSDSARYKALGNSIALPSWAWLLERLNSYCVEYTMASLFDGIGGFPLIWEQLNGKGSCVWASEIEDFPIAVTKYHFGGNK